MKYFSIARLMLIFVSVLFLCPNFSFAQDTERFSNESDVFILQIQDVMQNSSNQLVKKKSDELMPILIERWNSGRFNKVEKDNIKEISQKMADDNLNNDILFYNFFNVVNDLAFSSLDHESLSNFLIYSNNLYSQKGKVVFKNHIVYATAFLEKQILNTASNLKWYLRDAKYKFPSNTEFLVNVEIGRIVCASNNDSIVISNVKGVFDRNKMSWNGNGGISTWHRFKLDESKVYAELSKYTINMKTIEFAADSVLFFNKNAFNFPMLGRLNDKAYANKPNANTKFPLFVPYREKSDIKNIFTNININGSIGMQGADLCAMGNNGENAVLTIGRADTIIAVLKSKSFIVNDSKIKSDAVTFYVPIAGDSLSHNGLTMQYDNNKREIVLYGVSNKVGNGPFCDTYHKVNIFAEALYWNIDDNQIRFNELLSPNTESSAYIKSMCYFKNVEWDRLKGMDDYNPLTLIAMYLYKNKTNVVDVTFFASFINKNVEQVISMLTRLASFGYLTYDSAKQIAYPRESLYYAVNAKSGEIDYDVIRIESLIKNRQPNMVIDLNNNDLTVYGVDNVIVSEVNNVNIKPYNNTIIVKKGLDIEFSGTMMAGLFEFYTHTSQFKYSDFLIDLPTIDSISFYVKRKGTEENTQETVYVRVGNVITNTSGVIYIDENTNKSGIKDNPQYPIFDCVKDCYVNYGDMKFILPPFKIQSLFTFNTSDFNLKGTFHSDIFPDFAEELLVMDDYSLGFNHQLVENGMKLLDGNVTFYNTINLSNRGLRGNGTISFMTSFVESENFEFYKDSLQCANAKFEMLAVDDKDLSYPYAIVDAASVKMYMSENQLFVKTKSKPLSVYDNSLFNGVACLNLDGFTGDGYLNIDVAKVKSKYFLFENSRFVADSSQFAIVTKGADDAFRASGYQTSVDFVSRHGSFKNLGENSKLTFPFNKFECTLDKAEWLMDERTISMSSDYKGYFVSTNPSQDSLFFPSSNADYDMNKLTIIAREVDTLMLADAKVILSDGIINIRKDADIQPLTDVDIIVSKNDITHFFDNAELKIIARNDYKASGYSDYVDKFGKATTLFFNDIHVDSTGFTSASCYVAEFDNFLVSPDYIYKGNVLMKSGRKNFEFNGDFMMINQCMNDYKWFKSDTVIDPNNIVIPLNDANFQYNSGLFYDTLYKEFFVNFLSDNLIFSPDKTIASFNGDLIYNADNQCFNISDLSLKIDNCMIVGNGDLDLDVDSRFANILSNGRFSYDISNDEIKLDLNASLKFVFDEKLFDYLAVSMSENSADSLKSAKYKDNRNFVFEDLKMKWVSSMHCFVNENPIKIVSMKTHKVNLVYDGYLVFDYNEGPSYTLYLEYNDNQWIYFNYKNGLMKTIGTDNDFNNRLLALKENQRHFIDRKTKEEYEFYVGDFNEVNDFLLMVNYLKRK